MDKEHMSMDLYGDDEVKKMLNALDNQALVKIIRETNQEVLETNINTPLRSALPYSNYTKRSIGTVEGKKGPDPTDFFAGITSDAFYLRWVEKGTKIRTTEKGWNRGAITPKPVVIPFMLNSYMNVVDSFEKEFGKKVEEIFKKEWKPFGIKR